MNACALGRPPSDARKIAKTLRLAPHVIAHFKADGPGWQTRINDVLEQHVGRAERRRNKALKEQAGPE